MPQRFPHLIIAGVGDLFVERAHRREAPCMSTGPGRTSAGPTFAVCYKGQAWFELTTRGEYMKKCRIGKGIPTRVEFSGSNGLKNSLEAKEEPDLDMERVAMDYGPLKMPHSGLSLAVTARSRVIPITLTDFPDEDRAAV